MLHEKIRTTIFSATQRCDIISNGYNISEFTQQDGRKKRTAKCLCVTNVTGLFLACYVVIFT